MEQVRQHPDAALLDLRGLRILSVIDEVPVQVLRNHALRLGLHPGRHERREISHRDAVEHQLLADQAHGVPGQHALLWELVVGCGLEQEAVSVFARERD